QACQRRGRMKNTIQDRARTHLHAARPESSTTVESLPATPPQSASHAGDDQMGALDFRPPLCSVRHAGGSSTVLRLCLSCTTGIGAETFLYKLLIFIEARSCCLVSRGLRNAN